MAKTLPEQIAEAKAEVEKVTKLAQDLNSTITNIDTVGKTVTKSIKKADETVSASIGTLNNNVISLSDRSNELASKITGLSQDVGKLEDVVKSNKELSGKVKELVEKDGTLEQMPSNIVTILTKPDGEFNKLIDKYFSELMEEGPPVKAVSVSFDSNIPANSHQFIE